MNTINNCEITVQTILDGEQNKLQDTESIPSIVLDFQVGEMADNDMFKHYLSKKESQQISEWLTDAIEYIKETDEWESDRNNWRKAEIALLPIDNLENSRTRLIGQINYPGEANKVSEDSVSIDVASDSNNSYKWIRLIFIIDEVATAYCFSSRRAEQVVGGLMNALEYLKQNPPLVVSNNQIGIVEARASNKEARWLEIELEGSVFEDDAPRLMLNIFEDRLGTGYSSTWWFSDKEALELAEFLSTATVALEQQRQGNIGCLVAKASEGKETEPWLTVSVRSNGRRNDTKLVWVQLRFDDELVRESENDGILCLTDNDAGELSQLLSAAVEIQANYPPHIYVPPQPENVVISNLSWK